MSETKELIISAGYQPERWADVAARLCEPFPETKCLLQAVDAKANISAGLVHSGFTDQEIDSFHAYYSALNPWLPFWSACETMRTYVSDAHLPSSTFANSEFYRDWLAPAQAERAAGMKLFDTDERMAMFAIHYTGDRAEAYNKAVPDAMRELAPYVRAALDLNRYAATQSAMRATLSQVLGAIAVPAIVLDGLRRVRFSNLLGADAATRLGLGDSNGQQMRKAYPSSAAQFDLLLHETCASGPGGGMVLTGAAEENKAFLTFLPIVDSAFRHSPMAWMSAPEPMALVLVRELQSGMERQTDESVLMQVLQLTAAEARLAAHLSRGESLETAAQLLNISKETARTHLKRIFRKSGVNRQAELVALAARLAI